MGGVAGSLFMLWVRSGFSSATVASALTFFPPSPTYGLVKQADGATAVDHYIDANVPFSSTASLAVVRTKRGQEIPCFVFRHPEATFTMIYSHGNATDCGGMFLRYLSLSRVNVVGYDYTGYGGASGSPSEADTYADITAIYDHVVAHICTSSDPAKEIILYGQSGMLPCNIPHQCTAMMSSFGSGQRPQHLLGNRASCSRTDCPQRASQWDARAHFQSVPGLLRHLPQR
ncbi:hypothetical protein, variant 3 [Aphanomyces invadans]|uniref:Serine aminopeptidase S33 domain-containing protein n=1 Tax=Aphanomyces invadans TaxID=157072 RepID=A0A024U4G2_9STRA|nr:hypothetical protein, variant 3 [Aphanomyces invadans]ETW01296.1 hypothetical protein, variant 3 [Aphanomyces invadans]|eukprot:XP_008870294.1 hypothetical protein, variant 3 [Aphanomyces invadans]